MISSILKTVFGGIGSGLSGVHPLVWLAIIAVVFLVVGSKIIKRVRS